MATFRVKHGKGFRWRESKNEDHVVLKEGDLVQSDTPLHTRFPGRFELHAPEPGATGAAATVASPSGVLPSDTAQPAAGPKETTPKGKK